MESAVVGRLVTHLETKLEPVEGIPGAGRMKLSTPIRSERRVSETGPGLPRNRYLAQSALLHLPVRSALFSFRQSHYMMSSQTRFGLEARPFQGE